MMQDKINMQVDTTAVEQELANFEKQLIEALVSEVQIYDERQSNGQWIKSIKFRLPIIEENMDICLDNEKHVECVILMSRKDK